MGALGVEIVWLESGHGKLEEGSQHTAEPTDRLSTLFVPAHGKLSLTQSTDYERL